MHQVEAHRHRLLASLIAVLCSIASGAPAQAPFLSYNFDDSSLADFFLPQSISFCGQVLPTGSGTAATDELLITNDDTLGLGSVALLPEVVASHFPADSRNYTLKLRVNLESVNEFLAYVRSRIGIDEGGTQLDSMLEHGYAVVLIPQGSDALLPDGVLGLAEFGPCHQLAPHPEWPGAAAGGSARVDPGFPIVPGDWYWLEIATQGNDQGGPVLITAKLYPEGDAPPESPQLVVVDPNGFAHTPESLDPATETQLSLGTSYDFDQQPGATCRVDDISFTQLSGCDAAPLKAVRSLWSDTTIAEGKKVAVYSANAQYDVSIALSGLRPGGACPAPLSVSITETLPAGWTASGITNGGKATGNVIKWEINLTGGLPAAPLQYKAKAAGTGLVQLQGELSEPGSTFKFVVEGDNAAASEETVAPVSDFGSIQHWLILGPLSRQVGGANPGDAELIRDYLTDGDTTETEIRPKAGDTTEPDYNGLAASTGLAPNLLGRNPGDIPTWIEWRDYDDADDRVDFEAVYGDIDEVMCYAITYLNVSDDVVVNFGVSSDDSVQILLDGEELHKNNTERGALTRTYQDLPSAFPKLGNVSLGVGQHVLVVKVFEGGGENDFRVGFVDESGFEIPGGPPEIEVSLTPQLAPPAPRFHRGDSDNNGKLELTDAVRTLNFLFLGGAAPPCVDAADADDNGKLELTDAVRTLGFLFLGGLPPASPGPPPAACGVDPTPADTGTDQGCAKYTSC